jgi:PAS domain S-box-containing protein
VPIICGYLLGDHCVGGMNNFIPVGLSPEHLADIFPFHFCLDRNLIAVQMGRSLQRLVPALMFGGPVTQFLSVEHPRSVTDFDSILTHLNELFVLRFFQPDLRLRGQIVYLQEQGKLLFLGSPWMTEMATLQKLGLTPDDFSLTDSAVDLLSVLEAQESTLSDVMLFARELTRQRTELREANRQLTMMHTLAKIFDESNGIETAAPHILRMVCEPFGWKYGALWLPNRTGDAFIVASVYEAGTEKVRDISSGAHTASLPVGRGRIRHLQQEPAPTLLSMEEAIELLPHRAAAGSSGGARICLVPVVSAGKTIGLLEFMLQTAGSATEQVLRLLSEIGNRVGDFIDNRKVLAALIKQDRLLRGVAEATGKLFTARDLKESVQEVFHQLGNTAGFDHIALYENYRDEQNELYARRLFQWSNPTPAGEAEDERSFCYRAIPPENYERFMRGETVIRSAEVFSAKERELLWERDIRSLMLVPVFLDHTFWGLVSFGSIGRSMEWDDNEQSILITVAVSLSRAISHRRSEQALLESREQYYTVFNNVKEVIFQTDMEGRWTLLNPAWQEVTGFPVAESIGKSALDYVHPDDVQKGLELSVALTSREKEYIRHILRYLNDDGGFCWMEVFARLTLDTHGKAIGVSGTLIDITDRKRAEEEIRLALKRERELNELKSRFITTISHEFRTPLTAILSSSEILEHLIGRLSEEQRAGHFTAIHDAVIRMTELLDDVLFIGRAETGAVPYRPVTISLSVFFEQLLREIRAGDNKKHTITFLAEGESNNVQLDEKLLWQICSNLLSNALKYSPADTDVVLRVLCSGDILQIVVSDQGIGIPENEQDQLFDTFFRATNTSAISGTGLGLSIVKHAVDLLGGCIEVQSIYNKGTTFTVTLPISISTHIEKSV